MGARFWLRWSWRDLRRRISQVLAIATIVALGSGVYAGLGSTSQWRHRSLDATYSRLNAHDLKISLVAGSIDQHRLIAAVSAAAGPVVTQLEARLILHAPASAQSGTSYAAAAGELVGVDLASTHPIDQWKVVAGTDLTKSADQAALVDVHFASAHHLPASGVITIAQHEVHYVGQALSPEYLNLNTTSGEALQGQATRAVMFAPLPMVQELAHAPGQVNDVIMKVAPGTDVRRFAQQLGQALAGTLPEAPLTVTPLIDDPSYRVMNDEIDSEQHIFDIFALIILAGAGFAAFNLVKRVVERQRRDIGIAMSLGVPPRMIAIRTILLAAEITLLGVVLGVAVGWVIAGFVLSVIRTRLPLPFWLTPFQYGLFARAAVLALVIPIAASIYPIWRAVRVQPVDALLPPHLRPGRHLLTRVTRRVRLPGSTTVQAPFRRIVRAPTRSMLTIMAIALIMAPLLAAFGATDSATGTLDSGQRALAGATGDRLLVDLVNFQLAASPVVTAISNAPLVQRAVPGLNFGGYLVRGDTSLGISLSMIDLKDPLAAPASIASLNLKPGGIVISAKASQDLRVRVGDTLTLRHPRRQGTGFSFVDTVLPVTAIHTSPYRFVAYMDISDESLMGLEGIVNTVKVQPRAGVTMDDAQRQVAAISGVASALPTSASARAIRDTLGVISRLFILLQTVIAALAFLVAFNTSHIGTDERGREHATMFAFGIRIRRVVAMAIVESFVLGVIGIGIGLGLGTALLEWMLQTVFPTAVPDLTVAQSIEISSYLTTVGIGLIAVATAPLLNVRRLRSMDIPSALRYVE